MSVWSDNYLASQRLKETHTTQGHDVNGGTPKKTTSKGIMDDHAIRERSIHWKNGRTTLGSHTGVAYDSDV